jgi:protein-disulfide isomerase
VPVGDARVSRGPSDAKVTIVEYSDFQCPFCRKGYETIEGKVLVQYGDKVKFDFRHYPLSFHSWSKPAALAAECAKSQDADAYWDLYHGFFEHQGEITKENVRAKAQEFLRDSKIDMKVFNECFDLKDAAHAVAAQLDEGKQKGVKGTPTFFINGRVLSGAQSFDAFKTVIDEELAKAEDVGGPR